MGCKLSASPSSCWDPERWWVATAVGRDPGSRSSTRAAPHGGPTCWDAAPASPKPQRLQCSTTPRGPFPAAAVAGLAKNSRHRLLAATTVLNIASIDQAAGPAAQESRR